MEDLVTHEVEGEPVISKKEKGNRIEEQRHRLHVASLERERKKGELEQL